MDGVGVELTALGMPQDQVFLLSIIVVGEEEKLRAGFIINQF